MADWAHVSGVGDFFDHGITHDREKFLRDQRGRRGRPRAAHEQSGACQPAKGTKRRQLVDQRVEFKSGFWDISDKFVLRLRLQSGPRPLAIPIINETARRGAVISHVQVMHDAVGNRTDFRHCRPSVRAKRPQQVKRRRLVKRQARNARRTLARHAQRDSAAIRMADDMDVARQPVDDRRDASRLVGEAKSVRAVPMRVGAVAYEIGRDQREPAVERQRQLAPLASRAAGTVQRDNGRLAVGCANA